MPWKIGGEAGFGIMSAGTMLCRTFSRMGYCSLATNDYPSLIRGGHNVVTVRIATEQVFAMNKDVHILVCLNKAAFDKHKSELSEGSLVVFDPKDYEVQQADVQSGVTLLPVPLKDTVGKMSADSLMRNTMALGLTVALLGAPFDRLASVIADQFRKKGEEIVKQNTLIARSGFDYVQEHFAKIDAMHLAPPINPEKLLVMNGSEALGVGAVRAGLKFAAIYPMTPINSLITFLADHAASLKLVYKQPEDEIAGINMAIGASVAGVRSMVATSGGGFALMVEGLSLAGMVEAPLVIDLGMRAGPATGMPTYTEASELRFAIHAGHGEFPRIVLAPSDITEAYTLAVDAFHLADKFQVPVFLLTDKYLNESQWSIGESVFATPVSIRRGKRLDNSSQAAGDPFRRYAADTPDGVSTMSTPGTKNGVYWANSYEHDETGHVTEDAAGRSLQVQKRLRKAAAIEKASLPPFVYGDEDAQITFVSWGTTKGPIREAMRILTSQGKKSRLIHFSWLFPFPSQKVTELLSPVTRLVCVEQNATGQLAGLIREHTGILMKEKILKFDGRPLYPEEIVEKVS